MWSEWRQVSRQRTVFTPASRRDLLLYKDVLASTKRKMQCIICFQSTKSRRKYMYHEAATCDLISHLLINFSKGTTF